MVARMSPRPHSLGIFFFFNFRRYICTYFVIDASVRQRTLTLEKLLERRILQGQAAGFEFFASESYSLIIFKRKRNISNICLGFIFRRFLCIVLKSYNLISIKFNTEENLSIHELLILRIIKKRTFRFLKDVQKKY